jgi:site-specific DNA-methyltransferase (adenine-specific)
MTRKNRLFFGDNLDVLRRYIPDESVDLIYLDPPFNSNQSYNVLFKDRSGKRAAAQQHAFEDTWTWDDAAAALYEHTVEHGAGDVPNVLRAFRIYLHNSDLMAYLVMMAPRLLELHRVLKPTGSLYLHCDPTASHYLKVLLDAVFGGENFKTDIIWKRTTSHSDSKTWSRVSDNILFYTKSETYSWNAPTEAHDETYVAVKYRYTDPDGRRYRLDNITSPSPRPNMMYEWKGFPFPPKGWRFEKDTMARLDGEGRIWYPRKSDGSFDITKRPQVKRYLDEMKGTLISNVWTDIDPINSQAQERLGYPTQKPEALLERILTTSSNEGDVVLDPFCGCGTTVSVAERLKRHWIGIDITHLAIGLIKSRLADSYGDAIAATYEVIGEPTDLEGARALAEQDKFQFQAWALGLVGARTESSGKKGADRGVDGRTIFHDGRGNSHDIIYSVKGGKLKATDVRDLKGVVGRDKAAIGVLISLEQPSRDMKKEAATGEMFESDWGKHPKWQIVTIEELLNGKTIDRPPMRQVDQTFKRAPKVKTPAKRQGALGLEGSDE